MVARISRYKTWQQCRYTFAILAFLLAWFRYTFFLSDTHQSAQLYRDRFGTRSKWNYTLTIPRQHLQYQHQFDLFFVGADLSVVSKPGKCPSLRSSSLSGPLARGGDSVKFTHPLSPVSPEGVTLSSARTLSEETLSCCFDCVSMPWERYKEEQFRLLCPG